MAGIDVAGGGGRQRRSVDSAINMIPMIDLLMVTISFLLITAVWSHMTRLGADAQVPGRTGELPPVQVERQLHVRMLGSDRFELIWKAGGATLDTIDLARPARGDVGAPGAEFPELAARIESEWRARGQHTSPSDPALDQAVLHMDDHTRYRDIVAVMDAIEGTQRQVVRGARAEKVPAFNVTFAMN